VKIVRYPNRDMRTIVDERVNLCLSLEGTVYRHVSGKNNASDNAHVSITMKSGESADWCRLPNYQR